MQQSLNLKQYRIEICPAGFKILRQEQWMMIELTRKKPYIIDSIPMTQQFITTKYHTVSAILGVFEGNLQRYLITCQECTQVASVGGEHYYLIDKVLILPYDFELERKHKEEQTLITNIQQYLQEHFYFSTKDVSRTRQSEAQRACMIWNAMLLDPFSDLEPIWCSFITQGYINQIFTILNKLSIQYVLISRRSKEMSGPRFYHRGIDDDGNVANFVETEMLIINGEDILSHVVYRGSVPAFWEQKGVGRAVKITRGVEISNVAFLRHFMSFRNQYEQVSVINLMGEEKAEKPLNQIFQDLINQQVINWISYERLDMYDICGIRYEKINRYIKLKNYGFHREGVSKQNGCYRVNCLDCLDRTNLYQSRLAFLIFIDGLNQLNITHQLNLNLLDDNSNNEFVKSFQSLWADNGNAISQIYCGSDSTTSELTRQGKTTIQGFFYHSMATIERLCKSTLFDDTRYQVIEALLVGVHEQSEVDRFMAQQVEQYSTFQNLNIYVVTWNLGSKWPDNINLPELFQARADIIVVGFQEIVKLDAQTVIQSNQERVQMWDTNLLYNLKSIGDYTRLESNNLVGLFLTVFVQKSLVGCISKIEKEVVKTGFQGYHGNKGGIIIKFNVLDSPIAICNCHLASGDKKSKERLTDLKEIHTKLDFSADYQIVFGDLNFRLDSTYDNAMNMINSCKNPIDLIKLQDMDQLTKARNNNIILRNYHEAPITFLPTYKFEINTHHYDTKKQRTPSYCDRVLIYAKQPLEFQSLSYQRIERTDSDHKPVGAHYQIQIKKINKDSYQKILQEFQAQKKSIQQPPSPKRNVFEKISDFGTNMFKFK